MPTAKGKKKADSHSDDGIYEQAKLSPPDLSQYSLRENVPIFSEGAACEFDEDGNPTKYATEEDLEEICRVNNERFTSTGDMSPIFIGHRRPWYKETEMPPINGYQKDYKVGELKGKKVILCNWYVKDESQLAEYPRRSVEYFPKDKMIDGVAMLKRTPKLDLGMLAAEKENKQKIIINYEEPDIYSMDNIDELVDKIYARLCEKYPNLGDGSMKENQAAGPVAVPSPPSGGNTFVPTTEKHNPSQYQKEDSGEIAKLRNELDAMRAAYRKMSREKDLADLLNNGYQFDKDEEISYVVNLDDETYVSHLGRIAKNYQRVIKGNSLIPLDEPTRKGPASKERALKAAEFALKNNIKFEDALQQVGE